jgi:hypothetical protein
MRWCASLPKDANLNSSLLKLVNSCLEIYSRNVH